MFIAFLVLAFSALAQAGPVADGNRLLTEGRFREALNLYQTVPATDSNYPAAVFNQGVAWYRQAQSDTAAYDSAAAAFARSAELGLVFPGNYNRGNALFQRQNYRGAVDAYKAALRVNPADADAKHNLSLALAKLREQNKSDTKNQENSSDSKPQPQGGEGQQQPRPQSSGGMDRQTADRICESCNEADRETQRNLQRLRGEGEPIVEKDW